MTVSWRMELNGNDYVWGHMSFRHSLVDRYRKHHTVATSTYRIENAPQMQTNKWLHQRTWGLFLDSAWYSYKKIWLRFPLIGLVPKFECHYHSCRRTHPLAILVETLMMDGSNTSPKVHTLYSNFLLPCPPCVHAHTWHIFPRRECNPYPNYKTHSFLTLLNLAVSSSNFVNDISDILAW